MLLSFLILPSHGRICSFDTYTYFPVIILFLIILYTDCLAVFLLSVQGVGVSDFYGGGFSGLIVELYFPSV